jgi:O-antigen/teichoic acid export membrane protein
MRIRQGLTRRVAAGLSFSTLTILVTVIGQVIVVPVFITRWGLDVYGEWLVLTGTVSALTLLNLGIQSYVINLLIARYLQNEIPEGTRIFHSALLLYVILGGVSLLFLLIVITLPGFLQSLNITHIAPEQARVILVIYGLIAVYAIFGGLLMGLFRVVQQTPRQLAYGLLERVVILFVPLIVVAGGGGPQNAALWLGVVFLVVTLVELVDVSRRSPYPIGLAMASLKTARTLIPPSMMFFLISISATLLSTGVNIVIANRIGAAAVAVFTTTLMLTNLVRTVINQGLNVLWPEITGMAALTQDAGLLARWQRLVVKLAGGLALLAGAGTVVIGVDLLAWWTNGEIQVDQALLSLLALFLIAQAPVLVSTVFGLALSRQADLARVSLVFLSAVMIMSWVLLSRVGINGAALALLLVQVGLLPWQVRLACRWTHDQPLGFVRSVFLRWLPGLVFVLAAAFMLLSVDNVWLRLVLYGLAALIFVGLGWRVWLTSIERSSLDMEISSAWRAYRTRAQANEVVS